MDEVMKEAIALYEPIEQWMKRQLREMLDDHMSQWVHHDLYGIWVGPPNPVTHPWTIDGELGTQLMAEWVARGNGPRMFAVPAESKYVPTEVPEDAWAR